jgi:urease accessory protein
MQITEPAFIATWHARLALEYERRGERTALAARRHDGPLVVQKPLYPEGDAVCHSIIVHPPAGIVGGDQLEIDVRAGAGAHALLTTPGAGKWYRSAGAWAQQHNQFAVHEAACLEWLPQETIMFNGALARLTTEVKLDAGARYIGWEVLCLGRGNAQGERFERGQCHSSIAVIRGGRPLWIERGAIEAGGLLMRSAAGLNDRTVCGTMIAAADNEDEIDLNACRALTAKTGDTAVTRLPGMLIARYLGDSSEAAKQYFVSLWATVRPVVAGRAAVVPRIWNT